MGGFQLKELEIEQSIESISLLISYFNLVLLLEDFNKLQLLCTDG